MKEIRNSKPRIDLTGKTFTYLTPQYYIKGGKWHCLCKCGNELDVDTRNLNSEHTKSCGCLKMESKNVFDMINFENEYIKILERAGSDEQQIALWKCLCKNCGHVFIARGSSIRAGYIQSCGCIKSNGERDISKLLIDNNIEFAKEYTFPNLLGLGKGNLRFDFAIFHNGILSHLIEYNGSQHYHEPKGEWKDSYQKLIEHDKIKQQYCLDNNIRLVTIPYNKKFDIEDLL